MPHRPRTRPAPHTRPPRHAPHQTTTHQRHRKSQNHEKWLIPPTPSFGGGPPKLEVKVKKGTFTLRPTRDTGSGAETPTFRQKLKNGSPYCRGQISQIAVEVDSSKTAADIGTKLPIPSPAPNWRIPSKFQKIQLIFFFGENSILVTCSTIMGQKAANV